jgi:hypothetical protein
VVLPTTSYLCWTITVLSVTGGGLDLRYDGNNQETSITTPNIIVPEHTIPIVGLVLLIPLIAQQFTVRKVWPAKVRLKSR